MEISYWQSRWQKQKTGWHMQTVFPLLKTYWKHLNLSQNAVVLVPLCGKSLDLDWLLRQEYHVIGVDVSEIALKEVINRSGAAFTSSTKGSFTCFRSDALQLWCGDVLTLQKQWLPPVDAIYDKAALIALPPHKRGDYAHTLRSLLQPHTQIFMNSFEYEQKEMTGPPFAVFLDEIERQYGDLFKINLLYEHALLKKLTNFQRRGLRSYLTEKVYHLSPKPLQT